MDTLGMNQKWKLTFKRTYQVAEISANENGRAAVFKISNETEYIEGHLKKWGHFQFQFPDLNCFGGQ